MPIVDIASPALNAPLDTPQGFAVTPGLSDLDHGSDAPDWGKTFGAAFRQGNSVGSLVSEYQAAPDVEENFNPWDGIKGTKYEPQWENFADVRNSQALEARKRQIDMETEDKKTLDAAPWYKSLPAQLVAGAVDLPTLMPGGAFVKGAKGGFSVAKTALSVGAAAGASAAVQEAGLHATQETRTAGESAVNVGASVLLGGLLGMGGAKLLSQGEWNKAVSALDRPAMIADAAPVYDDVLEQLKAAGMADDEAQVNAAVFAARYATRAERLGEGATPLDVYKADGLEIRPGVEGAPLDLKAAQFEQRAAVDTPEFQNWFGDSKVVDENGQPLTIYHGSNRIDRIEGRGKFDKKRATSGPMSFFTDNKEIGTSYSTKKPDTSLDDETHIAERFLLKPEGYRGKARRFDQMWWQISPEERQRVAELAPRIYENDEGHIVVGDATRKDGIGNYDYEVKQARGNHFAALAESWLHSGQIFGEEERFLEVLKAAGVKSKVEYFDPNKGVPGVFEGYLSIRNPLDTSAITPEIIGALEQAAKGRRAPKYSTGKDQWDKSIQNPRDWIERLLADAKDGTAHAWTSIPDWVTDALRKLGYDGIKDIGGKGGGYKHAVWIPFDETQVKSVNNRGTFDPNDPRFMYQNAPDPRGKITVLKDNSAVIELFKKADKSTFMHESGHLWLGEMVRDAAKSPAIKADLDATLKWFGVDDASKIELKHHEQWARGFEEYLREGKAPSAGLAKAFDSFKQWLTAIYKSLTQLGPDHVPINDDVRGVMDRLLATDAEIAAQHAPVFGGPVSMGAAAASATPLDNNSIAGRAASAVAGVTQNLNPALRALHSPSAAYRDVALNLFENPIYLKKNAEGVASAPAVETFIKQWNAGLADAVKATDANFLEYRKAGGGDRSEFNEAVGKAMRRNDEDANPFVAKAAKDWRAKVFDPLKDAAIDARLLPADVSVDTAPSYFSRMWNRQRLIAKENEFKGIVHKWVEDNLPTWAGAFDKKTERLIDPLRREIDELETGKLMRAEESRLREEDNVADTSEMTESDIRQALRIVKGGAPRPKNVETLSQFVAKAGGLVDMSGELAYRGITNKARPGFVRKTQKTAMNDGGWHLDDMARHAWERGYFPEWGTERPSIDAFLNALQDDFFKTRAVVPAGQEDAFKLYNLVQQLDADLARAGVTPAQGTRFATSEEMKDVVSRVYKTLDAEADTKIAALKKKLTEREATQRVEREARFMDDPKELGRSIADEVFNTLTGKTVEGPRPDLITVKARGPLAERTFNIPDHLVEDFLESDIDVVGRRYARVMGADVELARKFGSVDLVEQIGKIREDYAALRARAETEADRLALSKRETSDIKDLEAMRDMLRGTDPGASAEGNYARIVRSVNHVNYLRQMGEVAIASLSETVRPAMVHGLRPYMQTIGQLATNLGGIRLSVAEAQQAGNVLERVLGHRLATMAEIGDPYASRGPIEAFLENMTNFASKWNGIRLLTDMQKSLASVMTQNRVIGNAIEYGAAKPAEKRYMAYLGIDESMAGRIAKQFDEHGETVDKVHVANTQDWTDDVARRTYRAAINKDVDSIITTKGVADVPLFANTPTGKAVLQFKSFALASHQRVLLRGLQEDKSRFMSGVVAMSTIGMFATWLKAMSGNRQEKLQDFSKNPGWWISEGLDKSGILAIPMEIANTLEKPTGFNPIKTPMKAFDQVGSISQKNQNRSVLGAIAGPSAGLIDDISSVAGVPSKVLKGEEISQGQKNAAERMIPFNSYFGLRQILRYAVNPPH